MAQSDDEVYDTLDEYIKELVDKVDNLSTQLSVVNSRLLKLQLDVVNLDLQIKVIDSQKKDIWE